MAFFLYIQDWFRLMITNNFGHNGSLGYLPLSFLFENWQSNEKKITDDHLSVKEWKGDCKQYISLDRLHSLLLYLLS